MFPEVLSETPAVRINGKAARPSMLGEHYHTLAQRIRTACVQMELDRAIGFTSCSRGAGVSTVAFNVAVAAAHADLGPVLYVDAGISNHVDRQVMPISPALGLADVLADVIEPLDCVVGLSIENLSAVAGRGKTNHGYLAFDALRFAKLIGEYKRHFRFVFVDIPAPTELNGSVSLSSQLDGVVLVIEAERAEGRAAMRTKQQLVNANANVLGAVLNKRRNYVPNWLYRRL